MCGIIGTTKGSEPAVSAGLRALSHRGPDDQGIFSEGDLVLGHCRLSIIDLSPAGHQPMKQAERAVISFNGEIYNYAELKEELIKKGCRFESASDTEVILQGYCLEGVSFFRKLRGMWAFALYDRNEKRVILSRDFFGIKPLYYSTAGGVLRFASEVRALKAISPPLSPNASQYYQFYNLGYFIGAATCYAEVSKALPGEVISWDLGTATFTKEILPLPVAQKVSGMDFEKAVSAMESSITDSLRAHYIADVEVGLLLSGGTDSSLLAALSKSIGRRPVAYHLAIPGSIDTEYARKISRHVGFELVETPLTEESLREAYDGMREWIDLPTSDVSILPTSLVYRSIRAKSKVVLSGEGGDELFGGYIRHRILRSLSGMRPEPSRFDRVLSKLYPASGFGSAYVQPIARRIGGWAADRGNDIIGAYLVLGKTAGFPIEPEKIRRDLFDFYTTHAYKALATPALFFDRSLYLPDSLMYKNDIASMASSIEARVPLVDREVAYAASGIPNAFSFSPEFGEKRLLKAILARHLPPDLVERPKKGFGFSFESFDADFFAEDFRKARDFHLENAARMGVPDDMKKMLIGLPPELIARKFPRFAFSLITNHLVITSS